MGRGMGPGGPGPPLESRIYSVKILKIGKISFSLLVGPPLGKIRSLAPGNKYRTIEPNLALDG